MSNLIYPGAVVRYISSHGSRPANTPRLFIVHTNAGTGSTASVFNYIQSQLAAGNGAVTQPHFQVAHSGVAEQYLDADEKGVASYKAEGRCMSAETQDYGTGVDGTVENDPFTAPQLETLAQIFAWGHMEGYWPLQMAKVPLPYVYEDGGLGWHSMWGINTKDNPNLNPWTTQRGKTCPGAAKIAQMPTILERAIIIVRGTLPPPGPIPIPLPEEQDVTDIIQHPTGAQAVTNWVTKRGITQEDAAILAYIRATGGRPVVPVPHTVWASLRDERVPGT